MQKYGLETGYISKAEKRDNLLKYTPKAEDLPPRSMEDSYMEAFIPLSTHSDLQMKYVSPVGTVRLGRLMEDMDMYAVWICQQHVLLSNLPHNKPLPYTFVTAVVDKLVFSKLLPAYNQDIRLTGHISWVGRTSMEVTVWLEQKYKEKFRQITHALFVVVARNANNTAAVPVNPLKLDTDYEKKIFHQGEERRKIRKSLLESSVLNVKPLEEEHGLMYELFKKTSNNTNLKLNYRTLPKDTIWMTDSFLASTFLSFPENRNAQYTVFGGFLMRSSFEISWICAYLHCGQRPSCKRCSDITFEKPVPMGSIIKMMAYIVYTEGKHIQIMTVAEILDPSGKITLTTNRFYYTFSCAGKVTTVLPRTYHETMWYIHGRRIFNYAMENEKSDEVKA